MYAQRESSSKVVKRAVDSLFIMACHGNMIQYDLDPKPAAGILHKERMHFIYFFYIKEKSDDLYYSKSSFLAYHLMFAFIYFRCAKGKSL